MASLPDGRLEVLALSEAHRVAVRKDSATVGKVLFMVPIVTICGAVFPFVWVHGGTPTGVMVAASVVSVIAFNAVLFAVVLSLRRTARRELAAGTFVRWTGPLTVELRKGPAVGVTMRSGGAGNYNSMSFGKTGTGGREKTYHLLAGQKRLLLSTKRGDTLIKRNLTAGSVDYMAKSGDVFEVRDPYGEVIDRDPHYAKALASSAATVQPASSPAQTSASPPPPPPPPPL